MPIKQIYKTYEEAQELVKINNITTIKNYKDFYHSTGKNQNMPSNPNIAYKDKWTDFFDFFGTIRNCKKYRKRYGGFPDVPDLIKQTINIKNIDIYSFFAGKYIIKNEELIIDIEPHLHLYSAYWIRLYTNNNTCTICYGAMIINKVESNYIYNNYKQVIKNGKQKILENIAESYTSYFRQKNKKGKVYIMNSKKNITKQIQVLCTLYGKYIVLIGV